jgi:[ribosomal protein S5]-alanine N-acetyltransferase
MVFLRSPFQAEMPPVLRSGAVELRVPDMRDYTEWSDLRMRSRAFLKAWEPTWPHDDLARASFRLRIKRYRRDIEDDHAYPYFIFHQEDGALLGGLTLSNVRRGVAQSASLGYWIGEPHARQGYMTSAVEALKLFAFENLRLHRVEAACLPSNAASVSLLRRCGFQEEGFARGYLKIDGHWRDHLLFALVEDAHGDGAIPLAMGRDRP